MVFTEQRSKILISHHTNESNIASLLSEYLITMGIPKEAIYLCALPSNEVKVKKVDEISNMLNTSAVNIPILSKSYIESGYCLNVTGAMIFDDYSVLLPIILPEINRNMILGFLRDNAKIFKLDHTEDVAFIYDCIQEALGITPPSLSVATTAMNNFIEKYISSVRRLSTKVSPTLISSNPAFDQLDVTTDDEMIVLYYILTKQVLEVTKKTLNQWLVDEEIYDIDIDNAFKLLATIGYARSHEGTLKIDIITFRRWSKLTNEILPILATCVNNHKVLSAEIFEEMWQNDELSTTLKLFTAYLIDENVAILGDKGMSEPQIEKIFAWEIKNNLPNTVSQNYHKCLHFFEDNNLSYASDWSIHGVPRKYTLNNSLKNYLFAPDFPHRNELQGMKG